MRAATVMVLAVGLGACQAGADRDVGVIQVEIASAPSGVACLEVTVAGGSATVARTLSLTPGAPTMQMLAGLPTGGVTVTARAFDVACASVTASSPASWVSDPVTTTLTAGAVVPVQLVMRRGGRIDISVDW